LKILVLSFYYKPDLSAGSFRSSGLIEQLKIYKDIEVEVVTTLPNRYSTYSSDAKQHEIDGSVDIHRVALPSHNSGMLDQIRAFLTFYRQAFQLTKNKDYDVVFATSSRLFTAFLGARIAKKKNLPLYLDIRDIFVDTIKDVLSPKITWFVKPIFSVVERYTFSKAKRINLVSKGFKEYFQSRYKGLNYSWYTNGIDDEFLNVNATMGKRNDTSSIKTVLYAGNIGEGQGLHILVPALAKRLEGEVQFRIIGDGGRRDTLQKQLKKVPNVKLLPPISRNELIQEYLQADVLFLHLNDYPAFKKVLPSKIFEYSALGKPIWAGVAGYAAEFLDQEVNNSAVFYPGNLDEAEAVFRNLVYENHERNEFKIKFARKNIMAEMAMDIIDVGKNDG